MIYLDIIIRSLTVYLFMIIGLRIFGKNQLSQLNAGDIVLLLLISNAVQNAMVGENTTLEGGLVAALVLFLVNFALKKLMFKHPKIKDLIEAEPVVLIKDGIVDEVALQHAEISLDELIESVHEHGVEKTDEVKLAILEVDGNVSVISFDINRQTHFTRHRKKKILRRKL